MIILPYAISLAIVGLLESLMTATIVDDFTDTSSSKTGSVRGRVFLTWLPVFLVEWPVAR